MGRNVKYSSYKEEALARAHVMATNDPIHGANQTSAHFNDIRFKHLISLTPDDCDPDTYYHRGNSAIRNHYYDLFHEIQKFNIAIRRVEVSNPTGVTLQQRINMAVAIHVGLTNRMEYKYKDLNPARSWVRYSAWLLLQHLPKFSYNNSTAAAPTPPTSICENVVKEENDGVNVATDTNKENLLTTKRASRGGPGRSTTKKTIIKQEKKIELARFLCLHGSFPWWHG